MLIIGYPTEWMPGVLEGGSGSNIQPGPLDWCDGASVLGFFLMISSSLIPCANCHPRF